MNISPKTFLFAALAAALILISNAMAQNTLTWASSNIPSMTFPKPPATRKQPVTDDYHGHKVVDDYRWLEDSTSPATEQWVAEQLAYTRGILDKLPGREQLHSQLEKLLQIGNLGGVEVGGDFYFHTRREGTQNQPVLYVRKGVDGKDDVLVDVNTLAKDGTVALDWWVPSHDGKYVTYGTSKSGDEISTLHIIVTATHKMLPDTIERTRSASIAGSPTTAVSTTRVIRSRARWPPDRRCTTGTSSITRWATIPRRTLSSSVKAATRRTGLG